MANDTTDRHAFTWYSHKNGGFMFAIIDEPLGAIKRINPETKIINAKFFG